MKRPTRKPKLIDNRRLRALPPIDLSSVRGGGVSTSPSIITTSVPCVGIKNIVPCVTVRAGQPCGN